MNEPQRLFFVQAQSDIAVFDLLQTQADIPVCHSLHYLQMATELLGKAYAWKHGRPDKPHTHRAFVRFLKDLRTNRLAQAQLGYEGRNENWLHVIRKSIRLAEAIEDLAPALQDGPNPEYPWPSKENKVPTTAPVEHTFALWVELQETAAGRQFLHLTKRLFATAGAFL